MSNYFYNKEIILLAETEGYLHHGVLVEGVLTETKTINCDVQPANREQIYKDYGYYIDCKYRVFSDVDTDIKLGAKVKYKDNTYKIVKVIEWDSYYDIFIDEVTA